MYIAAESTPSSRTSAAWAAKKPGHWSYTAMSPTSAAVWSPPAVSRWSTTPSCFHAQAYSGVGSSTAWVARSITSSPSTYAAGQPPALRGSRTVSQKPAVSTASPAQNAGCSAVTRPKSSSADTSVCRTAYPHRASATASGTRGQAARARRTDHTGGRSDRSVTGSWAGLDDSGEGRDRDALHSPDASASDACDADACGADSRASPGASDDTSGRDDDTSGGDSDAGDRAGAG